MAAKRNGIVTGYARMWPREVFDARIGKQLVASQLDFLKEKGIYILYRDEHPYYIGKSSDSLFGRLRSHANVPYTPYYNFWNLFSAFAVPDQKGRDELEAILIAAMPTVNSAKPKLTKMKFPRPVLRLVKKIRANKVKDVITVGKGKPTGRKGGKVAM
jgi:hypothetical protein